MTYDINKIFNNLKMHDGVNRILDEIEEMREKEKLYILSIDDLTQTAIVVDKDIQFMLRTLEKIIDDDRTSYVTPTQEEKQLLHLEFIRNASNHDLLIGTDGSIYKKVKDIKKLDRIIHDYVLRYFIKMNGGKIYEDTNKGTRP
jgi:hypothetical protein